LVYGVGSSFVTDFLFPSIAQEGPIVTVITIHETILKEKHLNNLPLFAGSVRLKERKER